MRQKTFDELMRGFLQSEAGEALVGTIMVKAVNQALSREIRFEDGKSDPGRIVEKTETWNILDWLVKYLPHVEAAVRGCQSDAAQSRNRSADVRNLLLDICEGARARGLEILPAKTITLQIEQGDQT